MYASEWIFGVICELGLRILMVISEALALAGAMLGIQETKSKPSLLMSSTTGSPVLEITSPFFRE